MVALNWRAVITGFVVTLVIGLFSGMTIPGESIALPTVGWGLMMGSLAILGLPPFGVFASEFLILTTAMRQEPWSTPILLLALGIAFAAVFRRVQPMVFGETTAKRLPHSPALLPVFAHLAIVLLLGIYIPPYLADWYRSAANLIAGF